MLDDAEALVVLRNQLLTTQVCTTGLITLTATKTGFTRSDGGSFVTDGFEAGMELKPAGFVDVSPGGIRKVTPTSITLRQERAAESAAANRSLTVGLPSLRAWENKKCKPADNLWFLEEEYISGPRTRISSFSGVNAEFDQFPTYVIKLYGFPDVGSQALYKVSRAVRLCFKANLALDLSNGEQLRVRSEPAPYDGQIMQDGEGFAFIVVTVPLRVRTRQTN